MLGPLIFPLIGSCDSNPPIENSFLLAEDGGYILLESGDKIIIKTGNIVNNTPHILEK